MEVLLQTINKYRYNNIYSQSGYNNPNNKNFAPKRNTMFLGATKAGKIDLDLSLLKYTEEESLELERIARKMKRLQQING